MLHLVAGREQALGAEVLEKSEAINSVETKVAALKEEVVELEAEQAAKEPLVSPWASVVKLKCRARGKIEWHDQRNERGLAAVQGKQARLSLPRPLPSPPATQPR